jgi:hypothetical protein
MIHFLDFNFGISTFGDVAIYIIISTASLFIHSLLLVLISQFPSILLTYYLYVISSMPIPHLGTGHLLHSKFQLLNPISPSLINDMTEWTINWTEKLQLCNENVRKQKFTLISIVSHNIHSELPLETWTDVCGFMPRSQLAKLLPHIGEEKV